MPEYHITVILEALKAKKNSAKNLPFTIPPTLLDHTPNARHVSSYGVARAIM